MWNLKNHGLLSSSFATTTATALLPTATSYPLIFYNFTAVFLPFFTTMEPTCESIVYTILSLFYNKHNIYLITLTITGPPKHCSIAITLQQDYNTNK